MNYVLTFSNKTAGYRCHDVRCSAAIDTKHQVLLPGTFDSVCIAQAYADADESEKSGADTKARFRACQCCRPYEEPVDFQGGITKGHWPDL